MLSERQITLELKILMILCLSITIFIEIIILIQFILSEGKVLYVYIP